ncbi:hypothetical protein SLS61_001865 [Didymella pomorum]
MAWYLRLRETEKFKAHSAQEKMHRMTKEYDKQTTRAQFVERDTKSEVLEAEIVQFKVDKALASEIQSILKEYRGMKKDQEVHHTSQFGGPLSAPAPAAVKFFGSGHIRFLHDPGNRHAEWALNGRVYSLSWEIWYIYRERNMYGLEKELEEQAGVWWRQYDPASVGVQEQKQQAGATRSSKPSDNIDRAAQVDFLFDPKKRHDYRGLEEHITRLTEETLKMDPSRKLARERKQHSWVKGEEKEEVLTRTSNSCNVKTQECEQQVGATQGSELSPKIGKEVLPQGEKGRSEAGPGPSTLVHRSRIFQDATSAVTDDATHEDLFLRNFLESHHQRMRAHIKKERPKQADRIKQAEQAAELEVRPADAASTSARPAPQPPTAGVRPTNTSDAPLESDPDYKEVQERFQTADYDIK